MVSVLTEDFGYHKVSIFSPYWMLNKSGLDIDYLVRERERVAVGKGQKAREGERERGREKVKE